MKIKPIYWITIFGLIGLDAITKTVTETLIGYGHSVTLIQDFFWLTVLHNTGAAWSLLSGQRWIFLGIALIALSVMLVFLLKSTDQQKLYRWALVFLIAGTFGNFMDRLSLGYVRDFLSFNIFGYMFPVFNVADISLNVGVAFLILEAFLEERTSHGKL